jgi:hypothetical protein
VRAVCQRTQSSITPAQSVFTGSNRGEAGVSPRGSRRSKEQAKNGETKKKQQKKGQKPQRRKNKQSWIKMKKNK